MQRAFLNAITAKRNPMRYDEKPRFEERYDKGNEGLTPVWAAIAQQTGV